MIYKETFSKLCMMACIALTAVSCKEEYEMIAPPLVTNYNDDLDEEVMQSESREVYFVTQFGEGKMDGSSWDDAMDSDGFRKLLSGNANLSKSTIYLSQGKYVMSENPGLGITLRRSVMAIKGGYSPLSEGTDLSQRDVKSYTTVFSGDVNGNKKADAGDCSLLIVKNGHTLIEGVTFQYGYVAEADVASSLYSSGIYVEGDATNSSITLVDCVVKDCVSTVTTATKQGGAGLFVTNGLARLDNVDFIDNSSKGRGGAIRCNSDNAVLMMNSCVLRGNTHSGSWGDGIQMSQGNICMSNCTLVGNTGSGGALNGGAAMLLISNTLVGDVNDTYGAVRCETPAGGNTMFINNVLLTDNPTAPSFNLNGSNRDAKSMGFNLYQRVTGITMAKNDAVLSGALSATLTADGAYTWDVASVKTVKNFATLQGLIDVANAFNPTKCPIASLGSEFVKWIGEDALGLDGRGTRRNPAKMQPGAYDAGLN